MREAMHDRPTSSDRDIDSEFKRLFLPWGLVAADCDDWLDGLVMAGQAATNRTRTMAPTALPAVASAQLSNRRWPVRAGRGQCPSTDDGVSKMDRV